MLPRFLHAPGPVRRACLSSTYTVETPDGNQSDDRHRVKSCVFTRLIEDVEDIPEVEPGEGFAKNDSRHGRHAWRSGP